MINIKVKGQLLFAQHTGVVADSVKFLTVRFEADSSWNGYTKRAVFTNAETGESFVVVLLDGNPFYIGDDTCFVPYEVIKAPGFKISLCGNLEDSVITCDDAFIPVKQSGASEGGEPAEPTPDEYAQIITIVNEAKAIAQSVRDDADNGVFSKMNVDQSYNSESENAQSGKAVAEAIEQTVGDINSVLATLVDGEEK